MRKRKRELGRLNTTLIDEETRRRLQDIHQDTVHVRYAKLLEEALEKAFAKEHGASRHYAITSNYEGMMVRASGATTAVQHGESHFYNCSCIYVVYCALHSIVFSLSWNLGVWLRSSQQTCSVWTMESLQWANISTNSHHEARTCTAYYHIVLQKVLMTILYLHGKPPCKPKSTGCRFTQCNTL